MQHTIGLDLLNIDFICYRLEKDQRIIFYID